MTNDPLVRRLEKLETAAVADVMAAMGLMSQVLSSALVPVGPRVKFAGPALCASGSQAQDGPALSTFDLDDLIYPGAIVVIATDRCETGAIIGDNMATSMIRRGAAGFVIDGGIRDAQALASGSASQASVPVFCRYRSPVSAHRSWAFRAFEQPIVMPGIWGDVTIAPGDFLLGDEDGIACLPRAHTETIIGYSERHMATEEAIKQALEAGETRRLATERSNRLKFVVPLGAKGKITSE
jgi:regulator of RNase E activity RraA